MNVLFLNFPWWISTPQAQDDDYHILRRGLRAGSRWPYTEPTPYQPDNFRLGCYVPVPYFLMCAAAWVKRALPETNVVLRDSIARGESYESFAKWLVTQKPDAVIIETGAASWEHDLRQLRSIKKHWPSCRIAVAGPPVGELSKKGDAKYIVDAWLLGEYEKNACAFVMGLDGVLPFDFLSKEELNNSPYPIWDEECAHHYFDSNPKGQQFPSLTWWASRGCAYKCSWCAFPATMTGNDPDGTNIRSVRRYDTVWLEGFFRERIEKAKKTAFPINSIYFDDDWFNNNLEHTKAVCEVMKRIGLPWFAMCRADTNDLATWQAMYDSGCRGVKVGFESGSQRVLDTIINKRLNIEKAIDWCLKLRAMGMSVHTTWTRGNPGTTAEEEEATTALIMRLYEIGAHNSHQVSGASSIAGTPMNTLEKVGFLAKYPGAKIDANYVSNPDGALKLQEMGPK